MLAGYTRREFLGIDWERMSLGLNICELCSLEVKLIFIEESSISENSMNYFCENDIEAEYSYLFESRCYYIDV